jgi:AcrR family transcriptional regulator
MPKANAQGRSTAADRGQEVRRRLLAAAVALVPERGWAAVSTRTVATRAGVTPGLVHYHFSSLQALLSDAAIGAMRAVVAETGRVLGGAATPGQAIDRMVGALDAYDGQDPTSLLIAETYLAAARDEDLRRRLTAVVNELRDLVADRFAAAGVVAPETTGAVFAAALDGIVLHRALGTVPDGAAAAAVLRRLVSGADETKGDRT